MSSKSFGESAAQTAHKRDPQSPSQDSPSAKLPPPTREFEPVPKHSSFSEPEIRSAGHAETLPEKSTKERIRATQRSFRSGEPEAVINCPPPPAVPVEEDQLSHLEESVARPKKVERPKTREKTWVEFFLVDREGNPVPGVRYRVKLPDGTTKEGVLDTYGQANFYQIDPGNCKISFPDLDKDAVEEA
jgi:hypothetical protein